MLDTVARRVLETFSLSRPVLEESKGWISTSFSYCRGNEMATFQGSRWKVQQAKYCLVFECEMNQSQYPKFVFRGQIFMVTLNHFKMVGFSVSLY
jgi:hypothetical protein